MHDKLGVREELMNISLSTYNTLFKYEMSNKYLTDITFIFEEDEETYEKAKKKRRKKGMKEKVSKLTITRGDSK